MTAQEREEMFARDVLTTKDIETLLCSKSTTASKIMREIKNKCDRVGVSGIVHVQDYLDFFKLPQARYVFKQKEKIAKQIAATGDLISL